MKKSINWKVRMTNPTFIVQLLISIFGPTLLYLGMNYQDLTTWKTVFDVLESAVLNPLVLGVTIWAVFTTITDPTTKGFKDSQAIINMIIPKKEKNDDKKELK